MKAIAHNLAALYWRARGDLWRSVECLRGQLDDTELHVRLREERFQDLLLDGLAFTSQTTSSDEGQD